MNSEVPELHSRRFAKRIHGKLGRAVYSVEGKRDMRGDAGDINNRTLPLLLHDGNDRQCGFDSAEEVGVECLATACHVQLRDRIQQPMAGVVYPNLDPVEMVQREAEHAIDFYAIAHIARKHHGALGMTNAVAVGFFSVSSAVTTAQF